MPASWRPLHPWVCPGGRRVLSYKAPRDQWLTARRALLCASDVAKVLGWSEWGDAYTIWLDKTGRAPDSDATIHQARGLLFEAPILALWAEHYRDEPIEYRRQGLMCSYQWGDAGASVDWLSICPAGRCLVEVKSAADLSDWFGDEIPLQFQAQVQWQLFVTGRDHVHVVALGPRFSVLHRLMGRDQVLIDWMLEQLQPWWWTHVLHDQEPAPTRRAADAIRTRYQHSEPGLRHVVDIDTAVRLGVLREEIEQRQHELDDLVAKVQVAAGEATDIVAADDVPIARWVTGRAIDGADAAWQAKHLDLVREYGTPRTTTVLDLDRMVAEHPELLETASLRRRRPWTWSKHKEAKGS